MLDLSPTKLIIIFIVVVVLLGPKRLPEVARQLGAGWRKLRDLHGQLDRELRQTMPDLPSSQDIVRFARSPLTLLNQLADQPGGSPSQDVAQAAVATDGSVGEGAASDGAASGCAVPGGASGGAVPNGAVSGGAVSGGAALNGSPSEDARPNRAPLNGNGRAEPGDGGRPAVAFPTLAGLSTDDPNLN